MIKLKDILKELDYGDKLWADPEYIKGGLGSREDGYKGLLKKMYKDTSPDGYYLETDTYEEEELWHKIKSYIEDGGEPMNLKLRDLLSLKKYFPQMLDPGLLIKPGDQIYRGMTDTVNNVVEYIKKAEDIEWFGGKKQRSAKMVNRGKYILLKGVNTQITSRGKKGFLSATYDPQIATTFLSMNSGEKGRWPIAAVTTYSELADKAIMNPEFVEIMGGMGEEEFWIVGSSFPAKDIIIGSPDEFGGGLSTSNRPFSSDEGKLIQQALSEKGFN